MRAHRFALAAAGMLGLVAPAIANAQADPSVLLDNFRPMQKDMAVDYDTPADKAAIEACKVETISTKDSPFAYVLRDGQGRILRMFADTNGKKDAEGKTRLDRWSYYKDGFEVYRELDHNEDGILDECRWLNTGGTRIAEIKDNRIARWTRISAEEASKVLVHGLVTGNAQLIETVMATPEELTTIGLPKPVVESARSSATGRKDSIEAMRKKLIGWDGATVWSRFDGMLPHVIPADAGLNKDLVLYENAFIFASQAGGQGDPMEMAYLQASDLVRVEDIWKFASLPEPINPKQPSAIVAEAGLRSAIYREDAGGEMATANDSPELAAAKEKLAEHDNKVPGPDGSKQVVAEFHVARVNLLRDAISAAATPEEKLNFTRQAVDSLAAAYQTGMYPAAAKVLDQYATSSGAISSYAAYRKVLADFALAADQPGADYLKVQKEFVDKLESFLSKYSKAEESADVLFQLASINEFNAEEEKARTYYERLASDYPDTAPGKKASGALRRLDLVGKTIEMAGTGVSGNSVNADEARGKTLLVAFWTTTADPVRNDLPELVKVYNEFKPKGFEIIGVNLDNDKSTLDAFLKDNPLPWAQIYEPGGMDSRLADEFGVISLPTMFLVDKDGKVLNRNLRSADEVKRYLDRMLSTDAAASLSTPGSTR